MINILRSTGQFDLLVVIACSIRSVHEQQLSSVLYPTRR